MIVEDNIKNSRLEYKQFSIIVAFNNDRLHLDYTVQSVLNQTMDFKENVQLILIDCASDDESYEIALGFEKQFPDNILVLSNETSSIADGRNMGFEYSNSEYVNFLDSRDYLDENALSEIHNAIQETGEGIICLPVAVFTNEESYSPRTYEKTGLIDIDKTPGFFLRFIYSAFIKRELLTDIAFDSRIVDAEEMMFANQLLLVNGSYVLLNNEIYYYLRIRNEVHDELMQKKEFFTSKINYFLTELIHYSLEKTGEVKPFIKHVALENLILLLKNTDVSTVLSKEELNDFLNSMKHVLSFISNDEIVKICNNQSHSSFLIAIKSGSVTLENILNSTCDDSFDVKISEDNVQVLSEDYVIDDLSSRHLILDFATLRDDVLYFSGYFESIMDKENISIDGIKQYSNGEKEIIPASYYHYPTRDSQYMMGIEWNFVYNFDLAVPIRSRDENSTVKLIVNYGDSTKLDCEIRFRKFCNISYYSNYYVKDDMIIMFDDKFNIMPYSYSKLFKYEVNGLKKVYRGKNLFFKQALFFRVAYLLLYPFMRNREIWIIMDRKQAADDNGEHFYKYALKQKDGIKKFFSINETSPDYERLEKTYGNVLKFESIKHRFYYTFADKIISSQGSEFYLNPFRNREYYQTAGISNVDFYFLQHGIIKDNMSSWLRKYDRNPKLIVTSTQLEYESLFDEGYNYGDKVIQLLGLPRYDNLNNQGLKRQIVIMPSWRNYLTDEEDVLNSEYFFRFNSLINNKRLIDHAQAKGYEIVFKPHPELVRYLYLFDKNDYVQIDENKKYQEIFNESAVLVTDYSSIFFDFSYLKKPLVYYQYGNDYHYDSDNGYFQYETMGFGPVIKQEDELVDKLIEYMDSDCKMEEIYKKRVDDFFKYHDHNNSKRCYDWIFNH